MNPGKNISEENKPPLLPYSYDYLELKDYSPKCNRQEVIAYKKCIVYNSICTSTMLNLVELQKEGTLIIKNLPSRNSKPISGY